MGITQCVTVNNISEKLRQYCDNKFVYVNYRSISTRQIDKISSHLNYRRKVLTLFCGKIGNFESLLVHLYSAASYVVPNRKYKVFLTSIILLNSSKLIFVLTTFNLSNKKDQTFL